MSRPLSQIAREINKEISGKSWASYAEAYTIPMESLNSINDNYYEDDGETIIVYALANLNSWRGDTARRIKIELNDLLKARKGNK